MTNHQIGGILLALGGLLGGLYALFYTLWTGLAGLMALGRMSYVMTLLLDFEMRMVLMALVEILVPLVQLIGFVLLFAFAALALYGGVVLYQGGPRRRAMAGAAGAVAVPLVGILVNYLGIVGELTKAATDLRWALTSALWEAVLGSAYNAPSFVLLLVEAVIAGAAVWIATRPDYPE